MDVATKTALSLYTNDSKLLVKSVTGFKEDDVNFQRCLDFVCSNLLHHTHVDVNSHEVKKKIARFHERYVTCCEHQKANKFLAVTSELINIFEQRYITQREAGFGILSVILSLAGPGRTCHSIIRNPIQKDDIPEFLNWSTYLREDNYDLDVSSGSESELELSEDESDAASFTSDAKVVSLPIPTREDSGLGISPDGSHDQPHNLSQLLPDPCEYLVERNKRSLATFYPYWLAKWQRSYGSTPFDARNMDFTKFWLEYLTSQNLANIVERKIMVHERNVVKEVIWMLLGVKQLFVFNWDGTKYTPNSQVHLSNLTANTLHASLVEFCTCAMKKVLLEEHLRKSLLQDSHRKSNFCLTHHTFVQALIDEFDRVKATVTKLDADLRRNEGVFTLLSLKERMKPVFADIDVLFHVHTEVRLAAANFEAPFLKACHLLQALWRLLENQTVRLCSESYLDVVLRIFLKSCKPFFKFWEELAMQGMFKDVHGEFVVRKDDVDVQSESFWDDALSLRLLPPELKESFFLNPYLRRILTAGKSLVISHTLLCIEGSDRRRQGRMTAESGDLYSKFIHIIWKHLSKGRFPIVDCGSKDKTKAQECRSNAKQYDDVFSPGQLLSMSGGATEKFFRPAVTPIYESDQIPANSFLSKHQEIERKINSMQPEDFPQVIPAIAHAFEACVDFSHNPVQKRLMSALWDEHGMKQHLLVMLNYFLMEQGDLMFCFYSEIFKKIFYGKRWMDMSFLYSALRNATEKDEDVCEKLRISVDSDNKGINPKLPLSQLNALQLTYEVEWPVTILLGPRVQNEYSKIFSYLMQIKCAKYLLDELYCINPSKYGNRIQDKVLSVFLETTFPRQQKIHAMYVMRARLLFFVNGLHDYVMNRIHFGFRDEFLSNLEGSRSVEEVICLHRRHLRSLPERCLLDRRLRYLKDHIFQVLHTCLEFQQMWTRGVDLVGVDELHKLEQKFSECTNYLSCCFNLPLRRGSNIELESLSTMMLSSTHSYHLFGAKS